VAAFSIMSSGDATNTSLLITSRTFMRVLSSRPDNFDFRASASCLQAVRTLNFDASLGTLNLQYGEDSKYFLRMKLSNVSTDSGCFGSVRSLRPDRSAEHEVRTTAASPPATHLCSAGNTVSSRTAIAADTRGDANL
jgi:hypothetical protein